MFVLQLADGRNPPNKSKNPNGTQCQAYLDNGLEEVKLLLSSIFPLNNFCNTHYKQPLPDVAPFSKN
jgi:hypothetical protein